MVKMAEWWLVPTTSDQCGQNPVINYYPTVVEIKQPVVRGYQDQ